MATRTDVKNRANHKWGMVIDLDRCTGSTLR